MMPGVGWFSPVRPFRCREIAATGVSERALGPVGVR